MDHREYKGKSVDRLGRSCLECAAHFFCLSLNADFVLQSRLRVKRKGECKHGNVID